MAKSTATFAKKEKEKKRLKKQQDKRERTEERKSNSDKGKSLEEMMAYVDENGNISSTPPDITKKKKFNADEIQVSVSKQLAVEHDVVRNGTITFFNDSKGYGFIQDHQTQESIFVHINGLLDPVKENDKVTFETEMGQKGITAIKVKKANIMAVHLKWPAINYPINKPSINKAKSMRIRPVLVFIIENGNCTCRFVQANFY